MTWWWLVVWCCWILTLVSSWHFQKRLLHGWRDTLRSWNETIAELARAEQALAMSMKLNAELLTRIEQLERESWK